MFKLAADSQFPYNNKLYTYVQYITLSFTIESPILSLVLDTYTLHLVMHYVQPFPCTQPTLKHTHMHTYVSHM